jgi:negative regulator of flagellin synthesis FlgM
VPSKINDLNTSANAGTTAAPVARTRGTPSGTEGGNVAPAAASGEVHITDTATTLASLEQTLRDAPVVDQARVSQLRTAIEQGTYTLRPVHIAERFLHLEHALGGLAQEPAAPAAASAES